jgi:hypothetical protein
MNSSNLLSRQGQRLLQIGVALFLLTSFEGFVIPYFASPMLGRSAHSLCALLGVMLIALGLAWPRLHLGRNGSKLAFWLLIYSGFAIVAAFLLVPFGEPAIRPCPWRLALHEETPCKSRSLKSLRTRPRRPESFRSPQSCGDFAS